MPQLFLLISASIILRIFLISYGSYHDINHAVKYTDVDYQVFTEAATYVFDGQSPYNSLTYRYTPLIAWLLLPNVFFTNVWGKIIFSCFDILTGYLIYHILSIDGLSYFPTLGAALWLFNPVAITVSTRGNAEAILSTIVLLIIYFRKKDKNVYAAILYGLSVHLKIYPIIYCIPLYLNIDWSYYTSKNEKVKKTWKRYILMLIPNKQKLQFVFVSAGTFISVTGVFYALYGRPFLHQTYFYHISRKDIRHNFSVYYLMFYITAGTGSSQFLSFIAFFPQFMLILISSFSYYHHLPFALFLNTAIFVTFNKVITSQYFLWYLSLLPLLVPYLNVTFKQASFLTTLWAGTQAMWLIAAYYLEFEGLPTYYLLCIASIAFFLTNCFIIKVIIYSFELDKNIINKKN